MMIKSGMASKPNKAFYELRLHGILPGSDIFGPGERSAADAIAQSHTAIPGQTIIGSGQKPTGVVLLLSGKAVVADRQSGNVTVEALENAAPPIFCVMESLIGSDLDLTVTAVTDCKWAVISIADFLDLLARRPEICLRIATAAGQAYALAVNAIRNH